MKLNEVKKDLRSLSGQLSNWGKYVKNPDLLQNISVTKGADGHLRYNIDDAKPLVFLNVDLDRHCLPRGIENIPKTDISVELKLTSRFVEHEVDRDEHDPIEALGVNFVLEALFAQGEELCEAHCSWHLDKGAPSDANFSHPMYHMNFGGASMTKRGNIFGNLLLLASPRLVHPPMDIILSCDFVVRNFYEKKNHQKLTTNPVYLEIVDRAQKRYWRPYLKTLSSKWNDNTTIKNLTYSTLVGH